MPGSQQLLATASLLPLTRVFCRVRVRTVPGTVLNTTAWPGRHTRLYEVFDVLRRPMYCGEVKLVFFQRGLTFQMQSSLLPNYGFCWLRLLATLGARPRRLLPRKGSKGSKIHPACASRKSSVSSFTGRKVVRPSRVGAKITTFRSVKYLNGKHVSRIDPRGIEISTIFIISFFFTITASRYASTRTGMMPHQHKYLPWYVPGIVYFSRTKLVFSFSCRF